MDRKFFEKILLAYRIGTLLSFKKLPYDSLHQLFSIQTTAGNFAVKILDPWIVEQYGIEHWNICETYAQQFNNKNIPAVIALKNSKNTFVTTIDNHNILIYPLINGEVFSAAEISVAHAEKIGEVLAAMHQISNISHRDITPQNVIWQNTEITFLTVVPRLDRGIQKCNLDPADKPRDDEHTDYTQPILVDWEYAGEIDPGVDLLLTALNFAGRIEREPVKQLFIAVVEGYQKIATQMPDIKELQMVGYINYCIDWLRFNLRRRKFGAVERKKINAEIRKSWRTLESIYRDYKKYLKWYLKAVG